MVKKKGGTRQCIPPGKWELAPFFTPYSMHTSPTPSTPMISDYAGICAGRYSIDSPIVIQYLQGIHHHKQQSLSENGKIYAKEFSWDNIASEYLSIYQKYIIEIRRKKQTFRSWSDESKIVWNIINREM